MKLSQHPNDVLSNAETIVIDGGPGAGKSTGMAKLVDKLMNRAYVPFVLPEVATEADLMGVFNLGLSEKQLQDWLMQRQLDNETYIHKLVSSLGIERAVILHDRALVSQLAYCDRDVFDVLLEKHGFFNDGYPSGIAGVYDRYGLVIHLDTAPKEYYRTDNNPLRAKNENTWEKAMIQNNKTMQAWNGFPHWKHATNDYPNFDGKGGKIEQGVVQRIFNHLGDPETYEWEKKYEVKPINLAMLREQGIHLVESDIEQDYLFSPEDYLVKRLRRRGWNGGWSYTYTEKDRRTDVEREQRLTQEQYQAHLIHKDNTRHTIKKKRYNFQYNGQYFELDYFLTGSKKGKWLLELELDTKNQQVDLPDFLDVVGEVDWKNEEMALVE